MNVPVMDYVGCGFDWLFVLLCLGGYFYILSKTGKKWVFMLLFSAAWFVMGVSYIFLIAGVAAGEWYITLIRTIGYVLFLAMILMAIAELVKLGKSNKQVRK
jgi:cytochrome c biogenesis protein CcdA